MMLLGAAWCCLHVAYLIETLHLYQIPTFQKPNQPSNSDWMGPLIWVGTELDLQLAQERHQLPAHSFGSKNNQNLAAKSEFSRLYWS